MGIELGHEGLVEFIQRDVVIYEIVEGVSMRNTGPLCGVKVVEIAGLGPGPFCGMMLADMGAEVVLVERKGANPNAAAISEAGDGKHAFYKRGKRSVVMDLKQADAVAALLKLVEGADLLIEGFRPGVMERLGLGPEVCHARNPRLVYGRMTGWGQSGPLSQAAGHDINYIGLSGALYYSGNPGESPFTPATVVGDVGAGAMSLAFGLVCGLLHARQSGEGQVIDAAIADGAAYMSTLLASMRCSGELTEPRGQSFFTAGAHWYNSYECADGHYITVGSLEPNFYRLLLKHCGVEDDADFADQMDKGRWPVAKAKLAKLFKSRPRSEWCEMLEGTDVCFGPVLNLSEAADHPHNRARNNFVEIDGFVQPAPAPKFSQTAASAGRVSTVGADTESVLAELGYSAEMLREIREAGAI